MGAPIVIPFNYQPVATFLVQASTSVFSTQYTVPAGKYAFIKDNLGGISLDGGVTRVGVHRVYSNSTTAVGPNLYNMGEFVGPVSARAQVSYSGSSGSSYSRVYAGYISSVSGSDSVGSEYLFVNRTGGGGAVYGSISNFTWLQGQMSRVTNGTCSQNIYVFNGPVWSGWVPAGTVIDGFDFSVTEYNVIS